MTAELFCYLPLHRRSFAPATPGWLERATDMAVARVNRLTCPDCQGCGLAANLSVCPRCRNLGHIKVAPAEWLTAGARYRAERKRRGETIADVAVRLNCCEADVIAMERGHLPIPALTRTHEL